jgi:hypothetical protein
VLEANGGPLTGAARIGQARFLPPGRIGLAYGAGVYLLAYSDDEHTLAVRRVNSSTGKRKGKARVIAPVGVKPAVAFDPDEKIFLATYYDGDSGSFLQLVNGKGKPVRDAVSLATAAGKGNTYQVSHVAYNESDLRVVTVGAEVKGAGRERPVGLGFDNALESADGPFVYDNKFSDAVTAAVEFRATGTGLVGWSVGDKGYIRALGSNGAPSGDAIQLRPASKVFPIAQDRADQFLVIWQGDQASLFGQEVGDNGFLIGASLRITGCCVESSTNPAAYNTITGETVVIYSSYDPGFGYFVKTALLSRP